jgi:hypothetical protein
MRTEGIRGGEWGGTVWSASRRLKRCGGNPRPLMRPSRSLWQQRCTLIRLPGALVSARRAQHAWSSGLLREVGDRGARERVCVREKFLLTIKK